MEKPGDSVAPPVLSLLVPKKRRDFKCIICDASFNLKSNLKVHIASVHEGKKPFKCNVCDASFARNAILRSHFSSVHEEKNLSNVSFICDASFALNIYIYI